MITISTNKFTGDTISRYNSTTFFDREDVYLILHYLQDVNLIDIIDENKLSAQLDDKLDYWEDLDEH